MQPTRHAGEYILETAKASPPITATALTLSGVSLSDLVLLATLVYTLLQLGWFIYDKFIKPRQAAKEA